MTSANIRTRRPPGRAWAKLLCAAVALGLLSGCVVAPAYGPGYGYGYYRGGYYNGYYYRDRDDYYYRRY